MSSLLPDAEDIPRFRWRNPEGNLVELDDGLDPVPRRIDDYRIDPVVWADERPARPLNTDGILLRHEEMIQTERSQRKPCAYCNLRPGRNAFSHNSCTLRLCREDFRRVATAFLDKIEIRDAGAMGKGVFATQNIEEGEILGEYLGELLPPEEEPDLTDSYAYEIDDVAICTAKEFGNWTRFINHRCLPNVEADNTHYGGRRAVVFTADRDIARGEQLFISYGRHYFTGLGLLCKCDVYQGDHLPPAEGEEERDKPEPVATGPKDIKMRKTGKHGVMSRAKMLSAGVDDGVQRGGPGPKSTVSLAINDANTAATGSSSQKYKVQLKRLASRRPRSLLPPRPSNRSTNTGVGINVNINFFLRG